MRQPSLLLLARWYALEHLVANSMVSHGLYATRLFYSDLSKP